MNKDFFDDFFMGMESEEIPKELHSVYENGPFRCCVSCEKKLAEPKSLYQIQKVYKKKRVIFEYALCFSCQKKLAQEYSRESTIALQNYFQEHFVFSEDKTICHLCQSSENILAEHTLMGLCTENKLIFLSITCGKCTDDMQKVLSEKTRKSMRDFIDKNFPGVPEELTPTPILKV